MSGGTIRRVWAILRREYVQRVRNKWFVITTLGFPLLILGFGFVSGYMAAEMGADDPLDLGVVDRAGVEVEELGRRLAEADSSIRAEAVADTGDAAADLSGRLMASSHDAFLVLEPEVLEGGTATLLARTSVSQRRQLSIREAVRQASVRAGLERAGLAADEAAAVYRSSRAGLQVSRVDQEGGQSQEVLAALALVFIFVLYMMFVIYGQIITRGVLEEKTSDIVEVLVSTVRPWELMLGKVLGIGAMGLTQIAIWIATLGLVAAYGLVASTPAVARIQTELAGLSGPLVVEMTIVFMVFFLTGYFLYASLFAAVGAVVGDQDEVQQVSFVPIMLIVLPFVLGFVAVQAGTVDSIWMTASSYFPFFTPILMVVRVTMGAAPAWEVVASVALMLVSIFVVARVAGRIYRVGILMKGKRPTLPELLRWVRYG